MIVLHATKELPSGLGMLAYLLLMQVRFLGILQILSFLVCAAVAHAQVSFAQFNVPTGSVEAITTGPDGALWFTVRIVNDPVPPANLGTYSGKIGRITTVGAITEYPLPTANGYPSEITMGPDGALWFTINVVNGSGKIGRITTAGAITEYPLPTANSSLSGITQGPDGALWYSLFAVPGGGKIGRITTAGAITEYPINGALGGITTGSDGALWFILFGPSSNIGRMTTAGAISEYPITSQGILFSEPTLGPDGAVWFTHLQDNKIGRITTAGVITQYETGSWQTARTIATGPDGALWFIFQNINPGRPDYSIGRITSTEPVTRYTIDNWSGGDLTNITTGPDGALWVTSGRAIGRLTISAISKVTISGPSPPLGELGFAYSAVLSAFGGTPPYKNWSVSSGSLPQGLGLNSSSGVISGIPTVTGTMSFSVTVQDSAGLMSAPQSLSITVNAPIPGLGFVGSMPHVVAEENWITTFTLVNKGAPPATARLSLLGDPSGTLPLPLKFPQQGTSLAPTASVDKTIASNASFVVQTAGSQTAPVQVGSAQLSATGSIDGFAILHHVLTQQETAVPMEARNAISYLLAFDNTGGSVLGVAVASLAEQAIIGVVIRDDNGTQLGTDSIRIGASGHASFVLPTQYPVTAGKRGTIEFILAGSGGQISVMGMRFTPPNNALTTIPALVNSGSGGGSIAHLASGNGWKTTFVLVNTGTSAAPVQLNFFGDNGSPLALPVGFPQIGDGATSVVSFVNRTLQAGATLLVESAAPLSDPAPTIGSAQFTSSGNVSGFVIFRYDPTGQEAVVPFESRNANAYLLAFDNTAGNATGVAVNSVSSQAVNVPVVIRDDAGNQIATDTLSLAANGHSAFTLVTDKYPATANIRGTIEFDTPSAGQISALAFRFLAAHTFTTLPALVK